MQIVMEYGRERLELRVADANLAAAFVPPPPALADPRAAMRAALDTPIDFPPLRQALTPDDRVVVVVDEEVPELATLLTVLLEQLDAAGVGPGSVTLLVPASTTQQPWLNDLPEAFGEVRLEVHDADDRKKLSYLATTTTGRRLYLNRTLVDADQVVILAGRRFDAAGRSVGSNSSLLPTLCDAATRAGPPLSETEMAEGTWLLGTPFVVEAVAGPGDTLAHLVGGSQAVPAEGRRFLDRAWRHVVPRLADVVVATLSGDPTQHTFADFAAAAANAARVTRSGGRVVLLSEARPDLDPGTEVLRNAAEADDAAAHLRRLARPEQAASLRWAEAAAQAHLYLRSGLADEVVEELFATPLTEARQAQRLVDAGSSVLLLPDAHKTLALLDDSSS